MSSKKKDEARRDESKADSKSAEALRASNELLSLFMRHSPVYAYIKSVTPNESRILQASDNYQRMLGSSSLDVVGKTMADLFPPEFAAKITADDWAVVANGSILQVEKDMDERSYISIKFPFKQGDKNMLAGYMFDITDRKKAEEDLRKNREAFRLEREAAQANAFAERRQAEEKLQEAENKVSNIEDKLRETEDKLRDSHGKLKEAENKLNDSQDKLRTVQDKLQDGENKLQEMENKLSAGKAKLKEIEDKLRAGETKQREMENKLRAGEDKQREDENRQRAEETKVLSGRNKLQELEEKISDAKNRLREVEGKISSSDSKLREEEDKLQASGNSLRQLEEKLRADDEKLQAREEKLREGEDKLQEIEDKLRADENKAREIDDKLRAGEKKLRDIDDKLRSGEGQVTTGAELKQEDEERLRADREQLRKEEERLRGIEEKLRAEEEALRRDREKLRQDRDVPRTVAAPQTSTPAKELLREAHWNARNDLEAIIGLMEIQRKTKGKLLGHQGFTDASLSALQSRIRVMSILHDSLSQSQDPSRIDAQDYLSALVSYVRSSSNASPELEFSTDAAGAALNLESAVPVGMIVNELVTNAIKYAFPKNQPAFGADKCEIKVSLEQRNSEYILTIDDNGVGLPKMPDLDKTTTLGLRLVRMLGVDQLGGKLTVNRTRGTRFVLKFNIKQ